jgi:hypothetical protein
MRRKRSAIEAPDQVGYGKPPRHTQFKPGRSGNPKGRPPGQRNLRTVLTEHLGRRIKATLDGRTREITHVEAIAISMVTAAVKGDARARDTLLRTMQFLGLLDQHEQEAQPLSGDEQKLLEIYAERIKRRLANTEGSQAPRAQKLPRKRNPK